MKKTSRKIIKTTKRKIKKNTKRRIKKNTKQIRNKIKRKKLRNSSKYTIRKVYKNKLRCKRGGSLDAPPPIEGGMEPEQQEPEPDKQSQALVEIRDGKIFKGDQESKKTITFEEYLQLGGTSYRGGEIAILSDINGGPGLKIFIKNSKSGERLQKELVAGEALGEIEGLITPITLQYLGFGDSKLPALVNMEDRLMENNYYIMYEFISKYSLSHLIDNIQRLPTGKGYTVHKINLILSVVMEDVLAILKKIHDKGWVHNDIKPDNIMVSTNHPKIDIKFDEDGKAEYTWVGEKPLVTIIDLDTCEKCIESCIETISTVEFLAPSRKLSAEQLAAGQVVEFNGRIADLASFGKTLLDIYQKELKCKGYLYDYNYSRTILIEFGNKLAEEKVETIEEAIKSLSGIKKVLWSHGSVFKVIEPEPEPETLTQEDIDKGMKICSQCHKKVDLSDLSEDDPPLCWSCEEENF